MDQIDEIWKKIPDLDEEYEVSNLGRIRSRKYGYYRIRKQYDNGRGYMNISLIYKGKSKTFLSHKLVALAFIGPRKNNFQVAHINGNRCDNRSINLRYCTAKENSADQLIHGTRIRGEKKSNSKLKDSQISEILSLSKLKKAPELVEKYKVSPKTIRDITQGKSWTHVGRNTNE